MRTPSVNSRLAVLTVSIITLCFGYFYVAESLRYRAAERHFGKLDADMISSVRIDGRTINDRATIHHIVGVLQRSDWKVLERRYSSDRQRLILNVDGGRPIMLDVRPLRDGTKIVQLLNYNPANQGVTVLLCGENSELGPLLADAHSR